MARHSSVISRRTVSTPGALRSGPLEVAPEQHRARPGGRLGRHLGTSGALARALLDSGWSPGAAVLARIGGASLVLAYPTWRALRGQREVIRRAWPAVVSYGLIAVAGGQLCYFAAVGYLSPAVALLIEYLAPALLVGWAWARYGRRPARRTLFGLGACLLGLACVVGLTAGQRLDPRGVAWGLAAAVCLAVFFHLSARTADTIGALPLAGGGLLVGAIALGAAGAVGLLPLHTATTDVTLAATTVSWWVPVLGLVLISTAFPYVVGVVATRALGATSASIVGLTEVCFSAFWAWLLLTQLPTGLQLLGGLILLAGVAIVQYPAHPQRERS